MGPVGHRVVVTLAALVDEKVALVVRRVEQEGERDLECLRHLEVVEPKLEGRRHEVNDWRDPVAGHGRVLGQMAEDLDPLGVEPDLLNGLAQRGLARRGIAWLGATAGEADLAGMIVQMCGASGEEDGEFVAAVYYRDEHRRRPDLPVFTEEMSVAGSDRRDVSACGESLAEPAFGDLCGLRRDRHGKRYALPGAVDSTRRATRAKPARGSRRDRVLAPACAALLGHQHDGAGRLARLEVPMRLR